MKRDALPGRCDLLRFRQLSDRNNPNGVRIQPIAMRLVVLNHGVERRCNGAGVLGELSDHRATPKHAPSERLLSHPPERPSQSAGRRNGMVLRRAPLADCLLGRTGKGDQQLSARVPKAPPTLNDYFSPIRMYCDADLLSGGSRGPLWRLSAHLFWIHGAAPLDGV